MMSRLNASTVPFGSVAEGMAASGHVAEAEEQVRIASDVDMPQHKSFHEGATPPSGKIPISRE